MDSRSKRQPRSVTHELVVLCDPESTTQRSPSSSAGQYAHLKPIRDGENHYETISVTRQQPREETTSVGLQGSEKGAASRAETVTEKEQEKYEEAHSEVSNQKTGRGKQISKCCTHIHATGLSHHQLRVICVATTAIAVSLILLIPVLTVAVVGYVHTEDNTEREQDLRHTSQQMAELIDALQSQLNMTAVNFTQNVRDLLADISSLESASATQYDKLSSDIHQLSGDVEGHSTNIEDLILDTNRLFTSTRQHTSRIDRLNTTKTSVTTFNNGIDDLSSQINMLSTSKTSVTTFNSQINALSSQISTSVTTFNSQINALSSQINTSVTTFNSQINALSSQIYTSVTTFNSQINDLSTQIDGLSSSKTSVTTFNHRVNRLSSLINSLTSRVSSLEADLSHHTATPHNCSCN